jgi:hypothetical protein
MQRLTAEIKGMQSRNSNTESPMHMIFLFGEKEDFWFSM